MYIKEPVTEVFGILLQGNGSWACADVFILQNREEIIKQGSGYEENRRGNAGRGRTRPDETGGTRATRDPAAGGAGS